MTIPNIAFITKEQADECVKNVKGFDTKLKVRRVLQRIFLYAKKEEYTTNTFEIDFPKKPLDYSEDVILYIDTDRQSLWLDKFEEEDTDFSLLCETLLILGLRPEERMWVKMESIERGYR